MAVKIVVIIITVINRGAAAMNFKDFAIQLAIAIIVSLKACLYQIIVTTRLIVATIIERAVKVNYFNLSKFV